MFFNVGQFRCRQRSYEICRGNQSDRARKIAQDHSDTSLPKRPEIANGVILFNLQARSSRISSLPVKLA
jgi:hypothetical protein